MVAGFGNSPRIGEGWRNPQPRDSNQLLHSVAQSALLLCLPRHAGDLERGSDAGSLYRCARHLKKVCSLVS